MKKLVHIIISILYIAWGIGAPLSALNALKDMNTAALISAGVGVLMLLAGIFGLFRIKPLTRRVFGIVIFIGAVSSLVASLKVGFQWQPIVTAVMAWLYIVW